MDQRVVDTLKEAGIDTTFENDFPSIAVGTTEDGRAIPIRDTVLVGQGGKNATVELAPLAKLLTGTKQPPSFRDGPTDEYVPFFFMLEAMALNYCALVERLEYDEEMARLYNLLRRRPDGSDPNPLFSYLRAAARLYLSLRDGSPAEFDAVLNRLTRSAKRFSEGAASTHYLRITGEHMQML